MIDRRAPKWRVKHVMLVGAVLLSVIFITYMMAFGTSREDFQDRMAQWDTAWDIPIILSQDPRIVVYHNFLTEEQINHLLRLAITERTNPTGEWLGKGTFLWKNSRPFMEDPVMIGMDKRIAQMSSMPEENLENFYVQYIAPGQRMEETLDAFNIFDQDHQEYFIRGAGQRVVAVHIFLNDLEPLEGNGDFKFTKLKLRVQPRRGTAIMFHPCNNDRTWNVDMLHTTNDVVGERGMWVASRWVRESNFHQGYTLWEV